jgi:hypothetical protein
MMLPVAFDEALRAPADAGLRTRPNADLWKSALYLARRGKARDRLYALRARTLAGGEVPGIHRISETGLRGYLNLLAFDVRWLAGPLHGKAD